MTLVAGVDSSTRSTRVEIRELDSGEVVGRGWAPHPPTARPDRPGCSEADPEQWWRALCAAMQAAVDGARESGALGADRRVAAVAVAGQRHGMVPLDAERRVIRSAKLWNDTETVPDAGWLSKQLPDGAAGWAAACGSVPSAAFTIAKLSWLHRSEPDAWTRLAHVVLPHDWLVHRLTGELVTDRGDASGTGYWSPSLEQYRFDLLSIVDGHRDWSHVVPRVLGALDRAGTITASAAADLGDALEGAVVAAGTGASMAVALGTGLVPGDAVVSIGGAVSAFAVSDRPVIDPTGSVAGFADATGRHLPLVRTLDGTEVLAAMRRLLGLGDDDASVAAFDDLALGAAPGAGGLTLLPYFDGGRTSHPPRAAGTLTGLRTDVSREQVARAAVEGVVCGALDVLDVLRRHVEVSGRVILTGGGSRSRAVQQIVADLAGTTEIHVLDEARGSSEPAAAGAAVQAAMSLTGESSVDIARRWALGSGRALSPASGDGGESVRDAYTRVRELMQG